MPIFGKSERVVNTRNTEKMSTSQSNEKPETKYTFREVVDFAKWYSGMDQDKVVNAWNRYQVEKGAPSNETQPEDKKLICPHCGSIPKWPIILKD